MRIDNAIEGVDYRITDEGAEQNICPVCGVSWLEQLDGEFAFGSCDHLRLSFYSEGDDFDYFNEWDIEGFKELVEVARSKDDNGSIDIFDFLNKIQHPDVDKAIFFQWHEDPLNEPWKIWGYKES